MNDDKKEVFLQADDINEVIVVDKEIFELLKAIIELLKEDNNGVS